MVIPYGFKSRLSHQIKNLHFSVGSLFLCQKTGRDLNPLAEGEHNRVFASETQRMMGRAHQVPSLAPKKATPKRVSFFFWCNEIRLTASEIAFAMKYAKAYEICYRICFLKANFISYCDIGAIFHNLQDYFIFFTRKIFHYDYIHGYAVIFVFSSTSLQKKNL